MNRANQKYILVLAISLLLVISFVYLASNSQNESPLNTEWASAKMAGIQNGAQSILQMAGIVSNKVQVDIICERDDFVEMDEYLDIRRSCLLKYCGDVCITEKESDEDIAQKDVDDKINLKIGELQAGNYANLKLKQKHFNCKILFESKVHDRAAPTFMTNPFKDIPEQLKQDYTYDGRIEIKEWYIDYDFPKNRTSRISSDDTDDHRWYRNEQWTKEAIDQKINAVNNKNWDGLGGAYGGGESRVLYETINLYKHKVIGKNVLVIGSETPWVEAIFLAVGAKHVTTLEYNRIISTHPQHDAILPSDLSEKFVSNGYDSIFDVVASYSSIEHSGLTRYGDAPHPWGDLVTMARNWCFMENDGMAFIGIPSDQTDQIFFNAHRGYGPLMLSHLFTNWKLKFASWPFESGWAQRVFVLEKDSNL